MIQDSVRERGETPSSTGGIARLAYARVEAAGLAPEPLLRKAKLTVHQMANSATRLNACDQIRFLNIAAGALDDSFLGFHLAQQIDLRELGLLYYLLSSSRTLGEALERAARYTAINNEAVVQQPLRGNRAGTTFRYAGVSRHLDLHQMEFCMTVLLRVCRELSGQHIVPSRVRFTHMRQRVCPQFAEFFGPQIQFGAPVDEVAFPRRVAKVPVISADPYLSRILLAEGEEALARRPAGNASFRGSVETALLPLLPHGKGRIDVIARRLGVSRRTLARRLALEGQSFMELRESLRLDLANRYLADESLSISYIAYQLGYREVGAFSHAYRRWTGKAPREARAVS